MVDLYINNCHYCNGVKFNTLYDLYVFGDIIDLAKDCKRCGTIHYKDEWGNIDVIFKSSLKTENLEEKYII